MIQIDMEMPKGCGFCPISDTGFYCWSLQRYIDWTKFNVNRPKDCPLIEVKE